mmetsp:Transcript_54543/g.97397  ORF Transcript_54543/g.97397 Transcript_54543/m.97397 type:complete len:170 (+) Transcript_54543:84-593(+)|eukprot:CAMPEP_0197648428 /NCGR_PEP_ID=MMETSP1338-20131121/27750_1 /TAXON_ID=43686 ORGANISM="Pelagodinium beii, Strain RCC1491" /NCGR_SAMPLE_ID=MMETSP1338 /ASSEMBLY_ACC=CAM_ASM_000754 /LENGTH=169 /DNA_ID=CAMNT_0043222419 /DNA_START=65 /DNA_END=574 /DNA_ORIENTATION=+
MAENAAKHLNDTFEGMGSVEEALKSALFGEHRYTQSFWEDVQAFAHAVDWWSDLWIFGLFSFEAIILMLILWNRRSWERLAAIFMLNTAILYFAERLNSIARAHWKAFSTQDYFDDQGVFASVLLGLPLLFCQFLIVGFLLREAASGVIAVKRMELRQSIAKKQKDKEQ